MILTIESKGKLFRLHNSPPLSKFVRFRLVRQEKVYDSSILSQERREYIAKAVNVADYLKDLEDYKRHALFYMKRKEWLRMRMEYTQEQLEDKLARKTIEDLSLSGTPQKQNESEGFEKMQ